MKFAFFHFNGLCFAERNLTYTTIEAALEIICFKNRRVYFSWDEQRIIAKESEDNSYFTKLGEYWIPLYFKAKDFDVAVHIKENESNFRAILADNLQYINDPTKYNQSCQEAREKVKAERKKSQDEYDQREKERKERAEAHKQEQFNKFKAGGSIEWNYFEEFCAAIGVIIPIKTKGWGRKGVAEINLKTYRLSCGAQSTVIFKILDEIKQKIACIQ